MSISAYIFIFVLFDINIDDYFYIKYNIIIKVPINTCDM